MTDIVIVASKKFGLNFSQEYGMGLHFFPLDKISLQNFQNQQTEIWDKRDYGAM